MAEALTTPQKKSTKIPREFIYEEIDGAPLYYRGYREAITQNLSVENIMGSGELQSRITAAILKFLYRNLEDSLYEVVTGEAGLHLKKNTNLSADIAVYDKEILKKRKPENKYFDIPPLVNIEVDAKAELRDYPAGHDYPHIKTQKLLDFGVQQVIWFFTPSRKVMIARPNQPWMTTNWDQPVQLLENYTFSLTALLQQEGIQLD